jgi:hypothetical protein
MMLDLRGPTLQNRVPIGEYPMINAFIERPPKGGLVVVILLGDAFNSVTHQSALITTSEMNQRPDAVFCITISIEPPS